MKSGKKPSKTIHLPVMVETDEDGFFIVSCPMFKGCHSYGKTIDEALKNIREVIEMCMEEEKPEKLNRFIGFREIEVRA
ncbi:MAG: type II toxin-antitoxin system HicB family antitoxin [Chitinophagales bacterium]|nr:type II toxin-antitoxin system HicB family antitoxin [Chitinophagales bacterium]